MALGVRRSPLPLGPSGRRHDGDQLGHLLPAAGAAVATAGTSATASRSPSPELLGARVADVEATIGVAPAPMECWAATASWPSTGAAALGWQAAPLRRNAPGCRGACQCAIGCPNNAKGGVHLNALPQACEAGARLVPGLRVIRW